MRFLLRLLLLLVLSSYLLRHYGFFLRENLWHMHSAGNGELLNRLPGITKDHPQDGSAQATLPPGVLPRHDLTPGATDPRVTQGNIRNTICRRGYPATVRPPFEYTNAMKHLLMRIYGEGAAFTITNLITLYLWNWAAVRTARPISGRNLGTYSQGRVRRMRSKTTCTIKSVLARCRYLRHNEKSPPIGMRSTQEFTSGRHGSGGKGINSEVVYVSSKASHCDQ